MTLPLLGHTFLLAGRFAREGALRDALARIGAQTKGELTEYIGGLLAGDGSDAEVAAAQAVGARVFDEGAAEALLLVGRGRVGREAALREALRARPSQEAFEALCGVLTLWPDDDVERALDLCETALASWPDRVRMAPFVWLNRLLDTGREPRLRVARALHMLMKRDDETGPQRIARLLAKAEPLSHIRVLFAGSSPLSAELVEDIVTCRHFAQVRALDLGYSALGVEGVRTITDMCTLPLRSLELRAAKVDAEAAALLAGSERLAGLRRLGLYHNELGDEGARALAHSAHLRGLRSLNLEYNSLSPRGAAALAEGPLLASVRRLSLKYNNLGAKGAAAIAGSPHLRALRWLDLGANEIGDEGAAALARGESLSGVEVLRLEGNMVDPLVQAKGVAALAATRTMTRLRSLDLRLNRVGDDALRALLTSPAMSSLARLDVSASWFQHAGLSSLVDVTTTAPLRWLNLSGNDLKGAPQGMWERLDFLRGLRVLNVSMTYLQGDAAKELATSRSLRALRRLDVSGNELGASAVAALLRGTTTPRLRVLEMGDVKTTAKALIASPLWPRLERVRVSAKVLGPEGVASLRASVLRPATIQAW